MIMGREITYPTSDFGSEAIFNLKKKQKVIATIFIQLKNDFNNDLFEKRIRAQ